MRNRFYSVEELTEILNLHPKTIQRFLREGRIKGRKIGRAWKVHHDELRSFAHAELAPEAAAVQEDWTGKDEPVRVSAVVEIIERDVEEASRISNSMVAMLNCKDPSWGPVRYDMMYDPAAHSARFVLYGSPSFIAAVMKLFDAIRERQ